MRSVALERKYSLDRVADQCSVYLDDLQTHVESFFVYAQHLALFYSVLERVNLLSTSNYRFSTEIVFRLLDEFFPLKQQLKSGQTQVWRDIDDKGKCLRRRVRV